MNETLDYIFWLKLKFVWESSNQKPFIITVAGKTVEEAWNRIHILYEDVIATLMTDKEVETYLKDNGICAIY